MKKIIGVFATSALLNFIVIVLISGIFEFLWNSCLVPAVTGLNEVGFFQSLGIIILVRLLFRSNVELEAKL